MRSFGVSSRGASENQTCYPGSMHMGSWVMVPQSPVPKVLPTGRWVPGPGSLATPASPGCQRQRDLGWHGESKNIKVCILYRMTKVYIPIHI